MNRAWWWLVIAILVIGLVAIFYVRWAPEAPAPQVDSEPQAEPEPGSPLPPQEPEDPPAFVTDPPAEPPEPLPELEESDDEAKSALAESAGDRQILDYLVPESVIRKLVASVDNATREKSEMKVRAVPPVEGRFRVSGGDDRIVLDEANYERYRPLAHLIAGMEAKRLADAYMRFYPLLQDAYQDLGYPSRQFHNRAIEVIDHLLATPKVEGQIRLVRPHVLYEFADPELESLSSGQKALIRMGPENATLIKSKLREVRAELQARAEASPPEDPAPEGEATPSQDATPNGEDTPPEEPGTEDPEPAAPDQ